MPQKKNARDSAVAPGRRGKTAVRRDTTLVQSEMPRRVETRLAPSPYAERQHARPGAGIKRARGVMVKPGR